MRIFRLGDEGLAVGDIQDRLTGLGLWIDPAEMPGRFGPSTERAIREFQERRSLRVDGLVGDDTWDQLVEAGYRLGDRTLYLHSPVYRGDDVRALQRKLNALGFDAGREDGMFGANTDRAMRDFQRNVGEEPDGIAGLLAIATLERMRPLDSAASRAVVREGEELRQRSESIEGRVIAIDSGEPSDGEAERCFAVASTLRDELAAMGAKPSVLAEEPGSDGASARARAANEMSASICISIAVADGTAGSTVSYFGSDQTHSPAGMLLAQLILGELEVATGTAGRMRGLTISMLRETRMPAVQVEPSWASAGEPAPTDVVAEGIGRAIAAGVRRFLAG